MPISSVKIGLQANGFITDPIVSIPRNSKPNAKIVIPTFFTRSDLEIKYTIINETGPDHDKTFEAQVEYNGKKLAVGEGKSKKLAEMEAARKALQNIK